MRRDRMHRRALARAAVVVTLAGTTLTPSSALAGACESIAAAYTAAAASVENAPFVTTEVERAEGPRYLATNVIAALQDGLLSADPVHPELGRGDSRYDLGLANPDNVYYLARIEPGADYRIIGRRGNSADLTVQALIGYPATGSLGMNAGADPARAAPDRRRRSLRDPGQLPAAARQLARGRSGSRHAHDPRDLPGLGERASGKLPHRALRRARHGSPAVAARARRRPRGGGGAAAHPERLLRARRRGLSRSHPARPGQPRPGDATAKRPHAAGRDRERSSRPALVDRPVRSRRGRGDDRHGVSIALPVPGLPGRQRLVRVLRIGAPSDEPDHRASVPRFRRPLSLRDQPDRSGGSELARYAGPAPRIRLHALARPRRGHPTGEFPTARIVKRSALRSELHPETPVIDARERARILRQRQAQAERRLVATAGPVRELALRLRSLRVALRGRCRALDDLPPNITQVGTRSR